MFISITSETLALFNLQLEAKMVERCIYYALAVCVLVFLRPKPEPSSNKHSNDIQKRGDALGPVPPSQKYEHYRHPTEGQHRTAEEFAWRADRWLSISVFITTVVAVIFAAVSSYEASRQANDAATQIAIANGPDIRIAQIHIWPRGQGGPQNGGNSVPVLSPGEKVDGALYLVNFGSHDAIIESANLGVFWRSEPLDMRNPLWGNAQVGVSSDVINPGERVTWLFHTDVPADVPRRLYVLGDVPYRSAQGIHYRRYFARTFDLKQRRFVETDDTRAYEQSE